MQGQQRLEANAVRSLRGIPIPRGRKFRRSHEDIYIYNMGENGTRKNLRSKHQKWWDICIEAWNMGEFNQHNWDCSLDIWGLKELWHPTEWFNSRKHLGESRAFTCFIGWWGFQTHDSHLTLGGWLNIPNFCCLKYVLAGNSEWIIMDLPCHQNFSEGVQGLTGPVRIFHQLPTDSGWLLLRNSTANDTDVLFTEDGHCTEDCSLFFHQFS